MSQAIQQFVGNLNTAKNDLTQLAGYLQQLKEWARSAYLEDARTKAADDPEAVEAYKDALELIYGITIDNRDDVLLNYLALHNYQQALDLFADFLENISFPENTAMNDKYRLFLEVMGGITIIRTNERHSDAGDTAFGYTDGHEIWDMFTIYQTDEAGERQEITRQNPMTMENFLHELFHSLLGSSGMGSAAKSPLALQTGVYWQALQSALAAGTITADDVENALSLENLRVNPIDLNQISCEDLGFEPGEDCSRVVANWNDRGYRDSAISEIMADYLLNVALGKLNIDSSAIVALQQAEFYNTPLSERIVQLGVEAVGDKITIDPDTNASNARVRISPDSTQVFHLNNDSSVQVLGRTYHTGPNTGVWVYIHVSAGEYDRYGWVFSNVVSTNPCSLPCLTNSSNPVPALADSEDCRCP